VQQKGREYLALYQNRTSQQPFHHNTRGDQEVAFRQAKGRKQEKAEKKRYSDAPDVIAEEKFEEEENTPAIQESVADHYDPMASRRDLRMIYTSMTKDCAGCILPNIDLAGASLVRANLAGANLKTPTSRETS
jgi:uncharacterized protein YjbI with pentapeptide repeats